jgi:hypothetical protein
VELNDKLKSEQKELLCFLNDIQIGRDDQLRLEDQMDEIRDQYQKESDVFYKVIDWYVLYTDPPNTLPLFSRKRKLKDQVLFNAWKPLVKDIQIVQETTKITQLIYTLIDANSHHLLGLT